MKKIKFILDWSSKIIITISFAMIELDNSSYAFLYLNKDGVLYLIYSIIIKLTIPALVIFAVFVFPKIKNTIQGKKEINSSDDKKGLDWVSVIVLAMAAKIVFIPLAIMFIMLIAG